VIALATLIWTIVDQGWDRLLADPAGFLSNYVSRLPARAGIKAALVGSAYLMALTALFTFPVGVGAAIYLEEFAPRNRVTNFVEANISNLAGVPRWSTACSASASSPASCAWGRACWPAPSPWP
jgi:phosphate transport system permease protein